MILNKLTLKNYKKYQDETIEFYDGMTGILGKNGVGKTSLVEAVLFALYGIKNTGLNNNFINSSESDDFAHVILEFSIDKDVYKIERKFKKGTRNTHKAKLYRNGSLYVDSSSQIEIELEKIIGMNIYDFKNSVYSGQKELMNIVDYSPAERTKWFMRMFNIDFLKRESEEELRKQEKEVETELLKYNVLSDVEDIDDLKWKKNEFEIYIKTNDSNIESYKSDIDVKDNNINLLNDGINVRKRVVSNIEMINNDIKNIDSNLELHRNTYNNLMKKFELVEKSKEDIKIFGDIESDRNLILEKYNDYVEKYNEYLKYVDKCNAIGENISTNYKFLDKLNEELKDIDKKEKQLEGYLDYIEERNIKNGELVDIERKDEICRNLTVKIDNIDNEFKHLNEKQNEIKDKIDDRDELILKRSKFEKSIVNIGLYKDRDENLSKLSSYIERRNAINNDINNIKKKINTLNETIESIKTLIGDEDELVLKKQTYLKEVEMLTNKNVQLEYDIKDYTTKLGETEVFLEELKNHGADSKCPFCDKVLGKAYEILLNDSKNKQIEYTKNIEYAKSEIDKNVDNIKFKNDSFVVIVEKLDDIYNEKIRYDVYSKSIKECHDDIIQYENNLEAVNSKIELLSEGMEYDKVEHRRVKTKLSELYDIKTEYDGINATIKKYESENLDNKLKEIDNKISLLSFDRNDYISELNMLDYDSEIKNVIKERLIFLNGKYEESLRLRTEILKKDEISENIVIFNETITKLISERDNYTGIIKELKENGYTKDAIDKLKLDKDKVNVEYDKYKDLKRIIDGFGDLNIEKNKLDELIVECDNERNLKNIEVDKLYLKLSGLPSEESYIFDLGIVKAKKEELQSKLSDEYTSRSLNMKELSTIIDKIVEIEKYEKDIKTLNTRLSLIKQTRRYISLYITHILKMIRHNIEDDSSYMINEITDGKYSNIKLDENFDIFLEDCGEYYNIDRFSGGEKDNVALSLRIALSHYLMQIANSNDSTFLIFDEIFGSQDEIRRNNLLKSLKTQENYFPQIFVISHMDNIDDGFTNKLQIEDDNGISHTKYL